MKHWSNQEKEQLLKLKKHKMSDDDCGMIMNRSAASIRDMWVKLQDQRQERYGYSWTVEEDIALIKGMKNKVFLGKYKRGMKETNQRRYDLLRPNGRYLHLHPEARPGYRAPVPVPVVPPIVDKFFTKEQLIFQIERKNTHANRLTALSPYQKRIVESIMSTGSMMYNKEEYTRSYELKQVVYALMELMLNTKQSTK